MTVAVTEREYKVHLRPSVNASGIPHNPQILFVDSNFKRICIKAGRRGGKTVGVAKRAVKRFLKGRRQLYAAPTAEQTDAFWYEITKALQEPIDAGVFRYDKGERFIELPGTKQRIKAKTAWNADTLRGDFADDLYFDEFQLTAEDAWAEVGAPMLLDNNGDAVFIFTPPSLRSTGVSKARDPRHASKMFKAAQADITGTWQAIHFTSFDNPFISHEALDKITSDMTMDAYRREILAEDDEIESSWLVHSKFNESLCKIKRFTIPTNWDVYSWHDFGQANPAALFVARAKLPLPQGAPAYMRMNDLVCFREYAPGAGFSAAQHVSRFKEITQGYNVVKRVGGNQTTEDEIRQAYGAHGWPIQAPALAKVNAQLDRVIGLEELNKFYVFEDEYGLLTQMATAMWKLDADNKPTNVIADEARYHFLAAFRYGASDFTPETVQTGSNKITISIPGPVLRERLPNKVLVR